MDVPPTQPDPLPKHDANAELQRQSFHALYGITKNSSLLLRDERQMDYGVDASFEIVVNGCPTNYRSQVQIKSTACAEINSDGSTSKAIEVANFNYLLNGLCPIYFYYSAEHDKFWYTWAFDELRRLESVNPKWKQQSTVTIRFANVVTETALHEIHSRIANESRNHRAITDTLARHTVHESPKIRIDPKTLEIETGDGAYKVLAAAGFTLISCGYWKEVLTKVDLLPFRLQRKPRIQLLLAYTYYLQGQPLAAYAHCGAAKLREAELSQSDREILSAIRDACECQIGKISREEYTKRQMEAAAAHGASIQCRIEAVRFSLLSERKPDRRSALLIKLRSLSREALSDPTNSVPFKLQTRMYLAYAEGTENQLALGISLSILNVQLTLKKDWARPDVRPLRNALAAMEKWKAEMKTLLSDAESCRIPWLIAEVRRTSLLMQTALLSFRRYGSRLMDLNSPPVRSEIEPLIKEAEELAAQFGSAGNIEGEMRARIAICDLYEIIDDISAAKNIAGSVKPIAEALGLTEVLSLAEQHLCGKTLLQATENEMRRNRDGDQDIIASESSDEEINGMAEAAMDSFQLPRERLANVKQDFRSIRLAATERLHWCRHIGQIQNLLHVKNPVTAYAAPPDWFSKCEKHGYESLQGSTDMCQVMEGFKRAYCNGCPDRDPKLKIAADLHSRGG